MRMRMTWERYCCFFFDIRRAFACVCALGALAVHLTLFIKSVPRLHSDSRAHCSVAALSSWKAYGDAYQTAQADWKQNGGPSEDKCQYYAGSHLPIYPRPGVYWLLGVGNK